MPHYESYESFKTKRSVEKKNRAKEKSFKNNKLNEDFIIDFNNDYGVVIETKYDLAFVLYNDEIVEAKLNKKINMVCNQVVFPGDKVVLEKVNKEYIINNLIKRKSILSRIKKDSTRFDDGMTKTIAANIDLAVIVVSAKEPPLHPRFIDRYLMVIQNSKIDVLICLNKCDLKTNEEEILKIYKNLGIKVIETSTINKTGIKDLEECLRGKQAIFIGNSGVGKSSLLNELINDDKTKIGQISNKSKRGCHTTTSSKYYIWDNDSSIIDTPGIRSLDISNFKPLEIEEYYKEFYDFSINCKYKDCLHYNESDKDCMVKQAVNNNLIDKNRYDSYCRIIESIINDKNNH